MSRYTKELDGKLFVYGFDNPGQEYFFACYDLAKGNYVSPENCVFNVATGFSLIPHPDWPDQYSYSKEEMVNLMAKYPGAVEKNHMDDIMYDLPI